ncbi:helix-turn-helix domain-containing protein [Streptomyces sp. NPDC060198]|uniref:helix-turn-helix domain-containing protein n=1 Tax=Streptomyces sp. NPDC060198 TaxID=3347070 RepID=UPI003662AE95
MTRRPVRLRQSGWDIQAPGRQRDQKASGVTLTTVHTRHTVCRVPRQTPSRVYEQRRDLGDRIRIRRSRLRVTQERLAELTGIDRRTLQRIERGESDPRYGHLILIADALGCTVVELLLEE